MDKISIILNSIIAVLLVVHIVLWIIERVQRQKKRSKTSIYIDVSGSGIKGIYEEVKVVNTTAELMADFTRCIETITQDREKNLTLEVSNSANGGYVLKTRFGSS